MKQDIVKAAIDPDADDVFAKKMLKHHLAAIEMATKALKASVDPDLTAFAQTLIVNYNAITDSINSFIKDDAPSADEINIAKTMATDNILITAQVATPLDGVAPESIMYMPAGKSVLRPTVNGKPKQITVHVTEKDVAPLQESLRTLNSANVRPFVDFNHEEKAASAIPKQFRWVDGEGIYLDLEWTKGGKESVEGRDYSYFSPTFMVNSKGEPVDLPREGAIGALTNQPAFRNIKRIAATQKIGGDTGQQGNTMDAVTAELVSLGYITEDDAGDIDAIKAGLAKHSKSVRKARETAELATVRAENESVKTELETVKAENIKIKEEAEAIKAAAASAEADNMIDAAVREGRIAPKNEAVKASLKAFILKDKIGAKDLLDSLPVNSALRQVVTVQAGQSKNTETVIPAENRGKACDAIVRKIMASYQSRTGATMEYAQAWKIAEQENPEIFDSVKA